MIQKKELLNEMKNSKALKSLAVFGKKRFYNIYHRARLIKTEFPSEIWIENTNCCNASCVMCPREKHTRAQGFMDFSLFEKLAKEISHFGNIVKRVHLHNYGEPLLDRDLARRIRTAKDCGIKHTYIVTTASLLTVAKSKEIIEAGLDEMKISFYGTDQKTYNDTMVGLDFYKTLTNVADFFKTRKKIGKKNPRVVLQYLPTDSNKSKTEDFFRILKPLIEEEVGDCFNIFELHNYGSGRSYVKLGDITRICHFPWRTMVILHDGKAVLCSPDYNGLQVVGDTNTNTIKEIWNGNKYKKVRQDFKKLEYQNYSVCKECTAVRETMYPKINR
ncbi:MAG: SPASM domain-containing protein [Candidatus Omnitrophica bacterium]|nr:SPASM domain-containing protein [Candidatus Omnitrophota bacterium]